MGRDDGAREELDRRRAYLVSVDPQHHPVREAPGKPLEAQLQPARIVGHIEDKGSVALEGEQDAGVLEIVRGNR